MPRTRFEVQADLKDSLSKISQLVEEIEKVGDESDKTSKKAKGFGDVFKGTFAAGLAQSALGGITNAMQSLGGEMIRGAADLENYKTQFGVMLGSVDKGTQMFEDLQKFGAVTPFETGDLAKSTQMLLAFGRTQSDIMPDLQRLGDIAGGNAQKLDTLTRAFGKSAASGKMDGEALNMLIDTGFNPLNYWADKTGKSMSELRKDMEKGGITFDMLKESMTAATSEGGQFFGMMDKQSMTLDGIMSTLKDTIGQMLAGIGTTLLPVIKGLATNVTNLLSNPAFTGAIEKLGNLLLEVITPVLEGVVPLIGAILTPLSALMTVLSGVVTVLKILAPAILVAVAAWGAYTAAQFVAANANNLFAQSMAISEVALKKLWAAMLANPVLAAVSALVVGVTALTSITNALNDAKLNHGKAALAEATNTVKVVEAEKKAEQAKLDHKKANLALLESYEKLGSKTERTKSENQKYIETQQKLAAEYPGLILSGASYADNMVRIKKEAANTTKSIDDLTKSVKELDARQREAIAQRMTMEYVAAKSQLASLIKEFKGNIFTDITGKSTRDAQGWAEWIMSGIGTATTREKLSKATADAYSVIQNSLKGIEEGERAKLIEQVDVAVKAMEQIITSREAAAGLAGKTKGGGGGGGDDADKKKRDEEYKAAIADLKREEDLKKAQLEAAGAKEGEILALAIEYADKRYAVGIKFNQESEVLAQLDFDYKASLLAREKDAVKKGQSPEDMRLARIEWVFNATKSYEEKTFALRQRYADAQRKEEEKQKKEDEKSNEEKRRSFEDDYAKPVGELGARVFQSLFDSQVTGAERSKMIWTGLGDIAMNVLGNIASSFITNQLMALATTIGLIPAQVASAATVAAAWSPAAALVSLGTFGANSAPAMAGISATMGLTKMLSLIQLAEGGVLNRPVFVAGEAGAEVVAPLNALPGLLAATMQQMSGSAAQAKAMNKRGGRDQFAASVSVGVDTFGKGSRTAQFRKMRGQV